MNQESKQIEPENSDWEKTNPLTERQNTFMVAAMIIIALLIVGYLASGIMEMLNNQNGG